MKAIVPAQSGYSVLHFIDGGADKASFSREPVVAWVVSVPNDEDVYDLDGFCAPITATNMNNGPIETPLGTVEGEGGCWPSAAEWFADMCEAKGAQK